MSEYGIDELARLDRLTAQLQADAAQLPPAPANFCAGDDETTAPPKSRAWGCAFVALAVIGTLLQVAYGLGWLG